jgi:hypothetical protein
MALNVQALATALAQVDINQINKAYSEKGVVPPTLDAETQSSIQEKSLGYAQAIHAWILTATINTNVNTSVTTAHAPGTINVVGTAAAQSNPVPVAGTGTGTGTGIGTLS